jgi:hypothetical protein
MSETLYTDLYIDDEMVPKRITFTDDECIDGKQGRTAKQKRDEHDLEINKLAKSIDKGHHHAIDKEDLRGLMADHMDIEHGNGIEPEKVEKEIIQLEGMLNTKTGELEYRTMQVCWCLFSFKMINSEDIGNEIDWCPRIIVAEKKIIRDAFGCEHLDMIAPKFFERYPDYVYSKLKEVKVANKRIRDRRKKR